MFSFPSELLRYQLYMNVLQWRKLNSGSINCLSSTAAIPQPARPREKTRECNRVGEERLGLIPHAPEKQSRGRRLRFSFWKLHQLLEFFLL